MNPSSTMTYDRRIFADKRRAFVLDQETRDFVRGCSPGCSLTAEEVEQNLSVGYSVIPGSLKFKDNSWTDNENAAVFSVKLRNGGSILGVVTIKALVEAGKVTAYSDIRILNVKDHPVALFPKQPKSPAEAVMARHLGRRPSP